MISRNLPTASVAALSVFLSSSAAFADVTPEQVWQDWQDYMQTFGYDMEAGATRAGDTLEIRDMRMSVDIPQEDVSVSVTMPEMDMTDNGDGTVSISIPPVMPMEVSVNVEGEDIDFLLDYLSTGFSMTVSGDDTTLTYDYSATEQGAALKEFVIQGESIAIGEARMNFKDVSGTNVMKIGDAREITQKISAGILTYALDFEDPEGGVALKMSGDLHDLEMVSDAVIPNGVDFSDVSAAVKAGFAGSGGFSYTNGANSFEIEEDGEVTQISTSSDAGRLNFGINAEYLEYGGTAENAKIAMAGGEVPFPLDFAMNEAGFNLQMPITSSDEEKDFAFGMAFREFEMSDIIWGLFDPAGQLPRDPATIAFDLTGKAKLFLDIMDPEAMEQLDESDTLPGELNALNINEMIVSMAGAALTGTGAFTFDNSDLVTFDGVPAPTGSVNLQLVGGNGLLDKLVAMGLLPEEQATAARLMSGLFTVPGAGEDTLTSTIEVTGDGQVQANGQRIR